MILLWRRQHSEKAPRSPPLGIHTPFNTLPINEAVNRMDFKPRVGLFYMTQVIRFRPQICQFWVIQKRDSLGWSWPNQIRSKLSLFIKGEVWSDINYPADCGEASCCVIKYLRWEPHGKDLRAESGQQWARQGSKTSFPQLEGNESCQ